ncbi:MAG TPA: hypothetical protein VHL11_15300 [Phototrophicaceae bacterium]|jgi:hypothetical protein|nr:hypothetical protein [Phototrophicaceae bacterium]
MGNQLAIGSVSPDALLLTEEGQETGLATRWANGPTLLTFLRHFG